MNYAHEIEEKRVKPSGPRPGYPKPARELRGAMNSYLTSRDLSNLIAVLNGWYPTRAVDKHNRIVIPCSNSYGIPYWQARAMADTEPRYMSPAATREDSVAVVYPKIRTPLGSAIVEGPMDALAAAGCGYTGVALMGNDPSPEVVEYVSSIVRLFEPVFIFPDSDHPEMSSIVGAMGVRGIKAGAWLIGVKDLASMALDVRSAAFAECRRFFYEAV